MCNHIFSYPEDTRENYNPDGKTLTGICRCCGTKKSAYGKRWAISIEEAFLQQEPFGESQFDYLDKTRIIC